MDSVKSVSNPDTLQLLEELRPQYMNVRLLDDGTIAAFIGHASTWLVLLECDRWGYKRRFSFNDPRAALDAFCAVRFADDVPAGGLAGR